jgi:hypothetical protein
MGRWPELCSTHEIVEDSAFTTGGAAALVGFGPLTLCERGPASVVFCWTLSAPLSNALLPERSGRQTPHDRRPASPAREERTTDSARPAASIAEGTPLVSAARPPQPAARRSVSFRGFSRIQVQVCQLHVEGDAICCEDRGWQSADGQKAAVCRPLSAVSLGEGTVHGETHTCESRSEIGVTDRQKSP